MSLKTYFIAAENEDGECLDLFIQAAQPIQAIELWREYHGFEQNEDTSWDGPFVPTLPVASDVNYDEVARVFEIQTNSGIAGALAWVHIVPSMSMAGQAKLLGHVSYTA